MTFFKKVIFRSYEGHIEVIFRSYERNNIVSDNKVLNGDKAGYKNVDIVEYGKSYPIA